MSQLTSSTLRNWDGDNEISDTEEVAQARSLIDDLRSQVEQQCARSDESPERAQTAEDRISQVLEAARSQIAVMQDACTKTSEAIRSEIATNRRTDVCSEKIHPCFKKDIERKWISTSLRTPLHT